MKKFKILKVLKNLLIIKLLIKEIADYILAMENIAQSKNHIKILIEYNKT